MILGSDEQAGAVYRMGWYFLIILLIPAFLSLIPERTLPIVSRAGRNSLSIYVLHNPLIFMIMHSGLKKIVIYNGVSLMMCSLLLTAALSFIPLNNVQNMQKAKTML